MIYQLQRAWELARGYFRPRPRADFYYPEEKNLYWFFDGKRVAKVDPLELYKALMEVWTDLLIDMKVAFIPEHKDSKLCHAGMLAKIRKVFNLPPKEAGGLNDTNAMELLEHFVDFCNRQKKSTSPSPTSAGATSAPSVSSPDTGPPTPSSLDSGSTADGVSTEPPTASPTGPQQPSGSSIPV